MGAEALDTALHRGGVEAGERFRAPERRHRNGGGKCREKKLAIRFRHPVCGPQIMTKPCMRQ